MVERNGVTRNHSQKNSQPSAYQEALEDQMGLPAVLVDGGPVDNCMVWGLASGTLRVSDLEEAEELLQPLKEPSWPGRKREDESFTWGDSTLTSKAIICCIQIIALINATRVHDTLPEGKLAAAGPHHCPPAAGVTASEERCTRTPAPGGSPGDPANCGRGGPGVAGDAGFAGIDGAAGPEPEVGAGAAGASPSTALSTTAGVVAAATTPESNGPSDSDAGAADGTSAASGLVASEAAVAGVAMGEEESGGKA
uniref:Uncharacterized protein n=1 Tax=Oryza glumipatula TaxID=40148 RepID=A0A0E0BBW8_9ORYZ